jgi:type I site-specific restriction-modification system R (restriction) subunit
MVERINLLDMQKQAVNLQELQRQYGLSDASRKQLESVQILTFRQAEEDKTKIFAKLPGGGIAFRHKEGGMIINSGETWIVELSQKGSTFFAKGLARLDSQFFFDLRFDQVDLIADTIWKNNRTLLEPMLEERYKKTLYAEIENEIKSKSDRKLKEKTEEINQFKEQLELIKKKYDKAISALKETKTINTKHIKQKKETKNENSAPAQTIERYESEEFIVRAPRIRRVQPDVLESQDFKHQHYYVHVSSDQSIMTIRPHDKGNILCTNKRITLRGLSLISSYGGPADFPAEYNPKYGGYLVYLKYIPSTSSNIK